MKAIIRLKSIALLFIFFAKTSVGLTYSQAEFIVDPGENTLIDAVASHPGETLVLKRGGEYLITEVVKLTLPTTIIGETEPSNEIPAVVKYNSTTVESNAKHLFTIAANCTLTNLGMMGYANDINQIGAVVSIDTPNISITIDNCIIQGASQILETIGNNGLTIIQKNNIVFNLSAQPWMSWGGIGNVGFGDSVVYKSYNNTFFLCGSMFNIGLVGPNSSEFINHNTYCNTWGETYWPTWSKSFTVKNNIFYNTQIRGYVGVRHFPADDYTYYGDWNDWSGPGITDTLCGDIAIFPHILDSTKSREVNIFNNLKMNDPTVLAFANLNNITIQPFIAPTNNNYAKKYNWDFYNNFLQENGTSFDPQFAMGDIPQDAFTNMFKNRANNFLPNSKRDIDYPFANIWHPSGESNGDFIWPLPFNLMPTNHAILYAGSDDYPLGDLNWFGKQVVANWEDGKPFLKMTDIKQLNQTSSLKLNCYPNPASDKLYIPSGYSSDAIIAIYDLQGKMVVNQSISDQIDITYLPQGIYIVKLIDTGKVFVDKLVKE